MPGNCKVKIYFLFTVKARGKLFHFITFLTTQSSCKVVYGTHNMASLYLGTFRSNFGEKIGLEGQNSFKTWISGKNSDFQIALESFFWTQKPSPSNPMKILTWNPMHQQNLCTYCNIFGVQCQKLLKNAFLWPKYWHFWPKKGVLTLWKAGANDFLHFFIRTWVVWGEKTHFAHKIMIFDNLAILAHLRPTLASWVQKNGHYEPIWWPRCPLVVPRGTQNMANHDVGAF